MKTYRVTYTSAKGATFTFKTRATSPDDAGRMAEKMHNFAALVKVEEL
jgi:hypothetical protein